MLSRVADSLYWMARYIKRAEHNARILSVKLEAMLERGGPVAAHHDITDFAVHARRGRPEGGTSLLSWIRRHRRFGSPSAHIGRWRRPAGFDGNSQYDRFLLRVTSRDPGRSRCR